MERCMVRWSGQRPLAFYGEQIFSGPTSPGDAQERGMVRGAFRQQP